MIPSSAAVKGAALLGALAVHAAFGWAVVPDIAAPQIEGGAGAAQARIGSSFADLAAGTLAPASPNEVLGPAKAAPPAEAPLTPPLEALEPVQQSATALLPEAPQAEGPLAPSPAETMPAAPEALMPAAEPIRAPATSPRPVQRSAAFEKRNAPQPPEKAQEARQPPQQAPRGDADTSASAGDSQGSDAATATRHGSDAAQSAQPGNAAADNYPGAVMRKISAVRKPAIRQSGSARVSFEIAASGALAGATITRSSGAPELDREAVRVIGRAAPFPPPPAGAQRSFSIEVEFR